MVARSVRTDPSLFHLFRALVFGKEFIKVRGGNLAHRLTIRQHDGYLPIRAIGISVALLDETVVPRKLLTRATEDLSNRRVRSLEVRQGHVLPVLSDCAVFSLRSDSPPPRSGLPIKVPRAVCVSLNPCSNCFAAVSPSLRLTYCLTWLIGVLSPRNPPLVRHAGLRGETEYLVELPGMPGVPIMRSMLLR